MSKELKEGDIIPFIRSKEYKFVQNLGTGSFSKTVLLKDEIIEELYACKKYDPSEQIKDEKEKQEYFDKFIDEVKILNKIVHPNIVRIYNNYIYPKEKVGFIIMEYVENAKEIDEYIKNNTDKINNVFEQLIDGFSYLEKMKLCHRDIRNKNILIDSNGVVKIIDFGFGKNYILDDYTITIEDDYNQFQSIVDDLAEITKIIETKDFSYIEMIDDFSRIVEQSKPYNDSLIKHIELAETLRIQEKRALDELDNINIVLLEIKSEIRNKHLPMISESYQDYIDDSYQKADSILNFIRKRPIDLKSLSLQVDAARDVIYKLYDNVHNLIVTAEMVEDAIVFGNRYRSSFLEVNTELTKAELLYRNGEYTKALSTAVDIIEKIKPDSYEMLVNKKSPKAE